MHIAYDPRAVALPREWRLDIDAGRVGCPVRGDTDFEACFSCGYLVAVDGLRHPRVICSRPIEDLPDLP